MKQSRYFLTILLIFLAIPLFAQEMITIKEDSPLYSEPNRDSRVIAYGIAGDKAEVIRFESGFYRIRYESFGFTYEGYLHQSAVRGIKRVQISDSAPDKSRELTSVPQSQTKAATVSITDKPANPVTLIWPDPSVLYSKRFYFSDILWFAGTAGTLYGSYELYRNGWVVLGRDLAAGSILTYFLRNKWVKSKRSWGPLESLEVEALAYNVTGRPMWTFAPGDQGRVVLTITNRGEKRVKGIRPKIKLSSGVLKKQFGRLKVRRGESEGRRRYLIGGFTLDPGETMSISATFWIPDTYPVTTIDVKGSLSRSIYGTSMMAVEYGGEQPVLAAAEPEPVVALVDVDRNIPKMEANPNAYAVVFGIEKYKYVSSVTFAKRDAHWVREYFERTLGIPNENIYYLTDSDVGKAEFDKVFSLGGWLDKRVLDGLSDVYVYYAGHGAPDISNRTAFLIPYDGDPNYASQTGYEVDAMTSNLSKLGARTVTVFLDACFSGVNRENEILLAGARPIFMEVNPTMAENVTLFSAASGTEISSAWPKKQHGLFTYWMLKGLQGKADSNSDKSLTVKELGDYIRENVSITAGKLDREQTPGVQTRDFEKVVVEY